ncbi:DDB1- and CUL4-associated factor 8-like [Odontomachus brunneus]|uniref:DDB1- and CUL4-associated factor 8-like n=1 Tax=Odontomachus brunneus TaxID=486640 RepID=UPI0013F259BB|nr:DDB1- and CUL4-associated factor 8-like [Odontomachus brunneus]XP_032685013.1 DDB1- and CUL4-associated factor 8-like [Odontomachus brunneus]XP_032685014.1 DDB1- and CUL4-associated factor 8-like [Odontomachus brunneus]
MDSESKTPDVRNDYEMNLLDMNNIENNKSSEMQSDSMSDVGTVNSSVDWCESSITTKDASLVAEQSNNVVSETMQNEQVHKSMKLPLQDNYQGIEIDTDECDKTNKIEEVLFTTVTSVDASEATTSQDNTPSSSYAKEPNTLHTDQNKVKRGTSMETLGDNLDEDSSKRQKLSVHDEENLNDDAITFQKTNSKMRQRNYRKRIVSDNEESSRTTAHQETVREASIIDADEGNVASASTNNESFVYNESLNRTSETREGGSETSSDGADRDENERGNSNEWTTASEDEMNEDEEPLCLKIAKPQPTFHLIPELLGRQLGCNPSFHKKYHGSLNVVERLKLLYELNEHQGCVNALNFNQKGNLLASGSDDLAVVIWDWARGKKRHWLESGHCSNMFQAKWLPFDMEYLMVTCGRDGQVRLLDLRHETSRRIATHHGASHKLAVHNETPHVIISVGEDAKVLSIDIRERKPSKLLVVKEDIAEVQLYSVHSNPFNSNEFCVAGRSHYVRVYDQRKVSTPLYKLCPDHLTENKYAHVTCAVYNYNGTEILASYNDEDIYLFDRLMSPCVDYAHRYQGHRNNATVKGVNFFGPKSEYVISGSDCGNIFIWDKNTEAVVQWMKGDEQGVVNCLEGHPHIPVLATSGLDYNVKIWIPWDEGSPKMGDFAKCVKKNARNRKRENEPDAFDGQMLWILLRHIRDTESARHRFGRYDTPDEDSDDEDDYVSDGSSNDNSWETDSEGDDIERLQCPPS